MTTGNALSGGAGGPTPPAGLPEHSEGERRGRIRALPDPETDLACSRLPLTDLGNAERWRVRFGTDFRFCAELGWLRWDGRRWHLLSEEKDKLPAEVMQSVFHTVRAIRNEAALVAASGLVHGEDGQPYRQEDRLPRNWFDQPGRREWFDALPVLDSFVNPKALTKHSDKIGAWAKTSEGVGKINAVAQLAKAFPEIAIGHDALDAEPMAINVLNGTLRLVRKAERRSSAELAEGKSEWKTGPLRIEKGPHRREDLITKLAPVKYSPAAPCPEYDAFLERVQPDETMRRFIHQWGGYSLTGDTGEQKLAFFYGHGRNGKGTWVEAVAHIAGDYAGSIPIESFLDNGSKRRGDQATPDIARLPGVRFLRVSEPEKGSALNEGLVKQVTGQDPVDARHLNKGFFTFLPSFKMTISGNHRPKIKDDSDGIWRRMQLVPWNVQIAEDAVDRKLGEKLRAEASGLLNRLLEGLIDWVANGLIVPEEVRLATRSYRESSDDVGRFLSTLCEVGETVRCGAGELHQLYQAWAEASGGATLHVKAFKTALDGKGFVQKQSDGMKWLGVRPREGVYLDAVKRGEWPFLPSASEPDAAEPGGGSGDDTTDDWPDWGEE
jgi:putative DNA primase/helicase